MSNNFDDIDNDAQNVVESDISQAVQSSYLDYAMSVIVSRALPDVRDGLKPVQRRILYSMYDCGFFHNKPHRKSARIVGDVMGKYHPHGDSSIYYAMVRMQQEFSLREPMIDGQGNFGSIDGDMPASMRYTESRLSKIANSLLEDIHYQTVDFKPNYDGLDTEPLVLPSKIPNLLVNGSSGIAVGMATNIPPHNLGQVIDACCLYVDNVDVSIEDLISSIEGPDFPSSSTVNAKDLNLAYKTGKGVISIKGKAEVEVRGNKESIVITQIPYTVNKAKLVEKIAELAKESKIEGIADLRDESSGDGIRVVVDLKQGVVSDIVMLKLYTLTPLQTSYGINMLALDRGIPRLMNLKDIIRAFVNFRREVIYKRSTFLVNQALAKKEILGGILTAVDHIEMIINIIRKSKDTESAKKNLMSIKWDSNNGDISFSELSLLKKDDGFYLTERQAKAILEMRLQKLTNLEKNKILAELEALFKEIKYYNEVLNSEIKLLGVLKEELLEIKKQFATKRLTKISNDGFDAVGYEELIPEEEMIATFTLSGYVKRVKLDAYKPQNRGGKGKIGVNVASDDIITKVIVGSSHSNLLFFTNIGRVYRIKMHQLPVCSLNSRGKQISSIVPFAASEAITSILIIPHDDTSDNQDLVFSTAKGKVRRNKLTDFDYIPVNGKIAMKLSDRDELIGVSLCSQDKEVFLATDYGKCIKFALKDLRIFKSRNSDGVRGIKLATSHKVITQVIVDGCKYNFSQRDRYLSIKLDVRKKLKEPQLPLALEKSLYKSKILSEDFLLKDVKSMAEQEVFLLSVTERGYAKCSSSYEYRTIARGGSGVANIAASEKIGKVVQVVALDSPQDQELIVVTSFGKTVRVKLANIRITGRNTLGVVLVKMSSKKEKVVSVALCSMETLTL